MNIETCVYNNIEQLESLSVAAASLEMPINRLVVLLLHRVMGDKSLEPKMFSRVRYQKRDPQMKRRRFHLVLRCDEYEKALDLRKVLKMSVSFILAFAIERYLGMVLDEYLNGTMLKNADKYSGFYFFFSDFSDHEDSFSIYWTLSEEIYRRNLAS